MLRMDYHKAKITIFFCQNCGKGTSEAYHIVNNDPKDLDKTSFWFCPKCLLKRLRGI